MKPKSGIYQIRNTENGKVYIGSTNNLHERKRSHFKSLQKNKHHNKHLQNVYNKYGRKIFVFEVLEEIFDASEEELLKIEQYYINILKATTKGYNIAEIAGRFPHRVGEQHHNSKLCWRVVNQIREDYILGKSQGQIAKEYNITRSLVISIVRNINWYDDKYIMPKRTKYHSEKSIKLISGENNHMAKLTKSDVLEIRKLYKETKMTYKQISTLFNIKKCTIGDIVRNKIWRDETYTYVKRSQRET